MKNTTDFLKPSPALLCKLGSIIVHMEEAKSDNGHIFDKVAFEQLIDDPDVKAWITDMGKAGFLPIKR